MSKKYTLDDALQVQFQHYQKDYPEANLTYRQYKRLVLSPCFFCGSSVESAGVTFNHFGTKFKRQAIAQLEVVKSFSRKNLIPSCLACHSLRGNYPLSSWLMHINAIAENVKWNLKLNNLKGKAEKDLNAIENVRNGLKKLRKHNSKSTQYTKA